MILQRKPQFKTGEALVDFVNCRTGIALLYFGFALSSACILAWNAGAFRLGKIGTAISRVPFVAIPTCLYISSYWRVIWGHSRDEQALYGLRLP